MSTPNFAKLPNHGRSMHLDRLIDPSSPEWTQTATMLQGNIMRGYGREHSALLLFTIKPRKTGRQKLKALAEKYVSSAYDQERAKAQRSQARAASQHVDKHEVFGGLYLSVWGYHALGYSSAELENAFADPAGVPYVSNWFLTGMEHQGGVLADPPRVKWEAPYRDNRLCGALLLSCDDDSELSGASERAARMINRFGTVFHTECGRILRDKDGKAIEHFGFRDGISMPGVFLDSVPPVLPRHLLVPDVLAHQDNAFGSYVVYRKLEQDVDGFAKAISALAGEAGVSKEYAEAMVVGRFKNGTPLVPSSTSPKEPGFSEDLNGSKCPFHAHIRKVNPRVGSWGQLKSNPIFRRGIPYDSTKQGNGDSTAATGVGLLFLAFQADIGRQFGVISADWSNHKKFLAAGTGTDALTGKLDSAPQKWPGAHGGGKDISVRIERFVTLKGGEFLFAPSTAFFRQL
jgi:Dyp-type peroxidase family